MCVGGSGIGLASRGIRLAALLKKRERGQAKVGQRYYTPAEVAKHNRFDDLWVSAFGKVYDLTALVKENEGHLVTPIIEAAGTDISHWFDPVTKNVRTFVDPSTEFEMPFTPMGHFLHCPPPRPTAEWSSNIGAQTRAPHAAPLSRRAGFFFPSSLAPADASLVLLV